MGQRTAKWKPGYLDPLTFFSFSLFSRPRYFDGAAISGGAIPGLDLGQGRRRRRRGRYPGIDPGKHSSDLRRLAVRANRGNLVFTSGSQELKIPAAMFTHKFKDGHGILLLKTKIPKTASGNLPIDRHSRNASERESRLFLSKSGSPIKAFGDDDKLTGYYSIERKICNPHSSWKKDTVISGADWSNAIWESGRNHCPSNKIPRHFLWPRRPNGYRWRGFPQPPIQPAGTAVFSSDRFGATAVAHWAVPASHQQSPKPSGPSKSGGKYGDWSKSSKTQVKPPREERRVHLPTTPLPAKPWPFDGDGCPD